MKKKLLTAIFALLMVIGLAACGEEKKEDNSASEPKTEENAKTEATGNVVEVNLTAKNFEFDQKEIKAKAGDTIKVTLTNEAGLHSVMFDGYKEVKQGETVEFVVSEAGTIEYYCNTPCGQGHDNMVGKLVVS